MGIKEHYRRQGHPEGAVKELEEILDQTTDQSMRNVLLFALRQSYEELQDKKKYLAVSRQIIRENIGSPPVGN